MLKVEKSGNPLITFGTTDIRRRFWPIAYMMTSFETTEANYEFFKSVIKLLARVKPSFNFDMKYRA